MSSPSILQVISQLQWVGSTSSAASWRAIRTWRSRRCCPCPTRAWPEWTRLATSPKAWRSRWRRPSTSPEPWPSSTSSCPWRPGTQSALTSSPASWLSLRNRWPSSVGCCCTRPSDRWNRLAGLEETEITGLDSFSKDKNTSRLLIDLTSCVKSKGQKSHFFRMCFFYVIHSFEEKNLYQCILFYWNLMLFCKP